MIGPHAVADYPPAPCRTPVGARRRPCAAGGGRWELAKAAASAQCTRDPVHVGAGGEVLRRKKMAQHSIRRIGPACWPFRALPGARLPLINFDDANRVS